MMANGQTLCLCRNGGYPTTMPIFVGGRGTGPLFLSRLGTGVEIEGTTLRLTKPKRR